MKDHWWFLSNINTYWLMIWPVLIEFQLYCSQFVRICGDQSVPMFDSYRACICTAVPHDVEAFSIKGLSIAEPMRVGLSGFI